MIDLHSHILPGIDDGAKSIDESLHLAGRYIAAGYRQVVATPHYVTGTQWTPSIEKIREVARSLSRVLLEKGIPLTLFTGMEVALDPAIPHLLTDGKLAPIAGSAYVLVETPFQLLPLGWERVIHAIRAEGFNVLMAHPERCAQICAHPELADQLVAAGCYLQVNWDCFLGFQGRECAALAVKMARRGLIHCLATDSHDPKHRHAGSVKKAAEIVQQVAGRENLALLSIENPGRVLKNEPLMNMTATAVGNGGRKKRRWWQL